MYTRDWLSDSHTKLHRAEQLLLSLHEEIESFRRACPFRFRVEADSDPPKAGANLIRVYCENSFLVEAQLKRFGVLAGEVVHHLRSGLNHLVWHLIIRHGNEVHSKAEFPIFPSVEEYDARAPRKLRGIPQSVAVTFRTVQPFNRDGLKDPLWRLHTLDIRDKHHVLLVGIGVLPVRVEHEGRSEDKYYRLIDGELVGRLWTSDPVGTEHQHPFSVALAEDGAGDPMILTAGLFDCLEATEAILHDFNQVF